MHVWTLVRDLFFFRASIFTVSQGGSVGLLALNALFVLMKEYNLSVYFSPIIKVFVC